MRFLKGAFNGLPGIDGWIRSANVRAEFKQYIPDGDSIWEFSVQATAKTKIKADAAKRMAGQTSTKSPKKGNNAKVSSAKNVQAPANELPPDFLDTDLSNRRHSW